MCQEEFFLGGQTLGVQNPHLSFVCFHPAVTGCAEDAVCVSATLPFRTMLTMSQKALTLL